MQNRAPSSSSAAPSNPFSQLTTSNSSSIHNASTQQAPPGQLPNRARIASSASNQTPPSAAGLASAQGGISASGGGGGSRLSRGSPAQSLPPPSTLSVTSAPSAGQSKTVSQILLTQVYVLLGRLSSEKDPAQREAFAEQIETVCILNIRALPNSSGRRIFCHGSLSKVLSKAAHVKRAVCL
jgi:hypothetical protein